MNRIVRLKTWDEFKKLATSLRPKTIVYFLQRAPLSKPPIGLRLIFTSKRHQYVFIDYAEKETLRQTKISISTDNQGEVNITDEDIKRFITTELKRTDLLILSPVWRLEWQ